MHVIVLLNFGATFIACHTSVDLIIELFAISHNHPR